MSIELGAVVASARARPTIAPAVMEVLAEQNRAWGASPAREASLEALRSSARVVVTGQQVGLCLGPLFAIHKAASAVRLARRLTTEGLRAVPMFWLQAEDHDWAEVRTLRWPAAGAIVEASLPERESSLARRSLAHQRVGPGIASVLEQLESSLGERGWIERLTRHYRPEALMPEAFGGLIAELFEPFGLLTFQPRVEAIAPLAAQLHRVMIRDHEMIAARMQARARALEASGQPAPIPVRADCTLSFFHPEGADGARYRMVPGERIALSGSEETFSRAEIEHRLEHAPMDFSTSALLRPVLQDSLLPTAAYVGGPAEVAYAAQLPPLYEHVGIAPAPFVRRASFVITTAGDRQDLRALGLERGELAADERELLQRLGRGPLSLELEALASGALARLEAMREPMEAIDPGLGKSLERSRATIEESLSKLRARLERAAATHRPELVARLRSVRARLRPDGDPQERVHGLPLIDERVISDVIAREVEQAEPGREQEIAL